VYKTLLRSLSVMERPSGVCVDYTRWGIRIVTWLFGPPSTDIGVATLNEKVNASKDWIVKVIFLVAGELEMSTP